jgi:hypothetical protein
VRFSGSTECPTYSVVPGGGYGIVGIQPVLKQLSVFSSTYVLDRDLVGVTMPSAAAAFMFLGRMCSCARFVKVQQTLQVTLDNLQVFIQLENKTVFLEPRLL